MLYFLGFVKPLVQLTIERRLQKKQAMTEGGVEISLNPEDMDLDQRGLEAKYEEQLRKQQKVRYGPGSTVS